MRTPSAGGGWPAIWYTLKQARSAGGLLRMWRALRSRNACKTCALGMGGQAGGMVNEAGHFPEVCKKSVQAMAADMRGAVRDGFLASTTLEQMGRLSPRELEAAGRLVRPLVAAPGDRHYRPVTWEEAMERAGAALRESPPQETFFYASGRSSNEAGFLLQLVARLHGSNNVNNCSYFCHNASGVALKEAIGSGAGTIDLEGLSACDLVVLVGANPASNHPRLMRTLMDLKRRGGRVVVVNPLREVGLVRFRVPSDPRSLLFGTDIADLYLQPHAGGDAALFTALARVLLARGAVDREFVESRTEGFEAWRHEVEAEAPAALLERAGVSAAEVEWLADAVAGSRAMVLAWTMGITHHLHGVANVHAMTNIALMRGMVGRPGAGLLPLRGHSNVQGMGTVGVSPVPSAAFLDALERRAGVSMPREPGWDTMECLRRASAGGVRAALHLGGNLFGSAPDAAWAQQALSRIGTTIFLSTSLNTGHVHGRGATSIILPVRARDEETEVTTQESMFSWVRVSSGGAPRFTDAPGGGPRGEVAVIAALAAEAVRRAGPLDFQALRAHASLRRWISEAVPELAALAGVEEAPREFVVPGRIHREPVFPRPGGRARFVPARVPAAPTVEGQLRLMTIRSEGQFNTVVYEDHDTYRGQERRDVILMSGEDMARMNLRADDRVRVESDTGAMDGILVRAAPIRPGNAAMYYPEANVLVPATTDPRSGTPAFKHVPIRVRASTRLPVLG